MKHISFAVAASLACFATACSQWTVIKSVEPNPYAAGGCKVSVQPLNFTGIRVGAITEEQWLAKKPPEETASYGADKTTMAANFQSELLGNATGLSAGAPAPYSLKTKVTMWEPGFFTAFVNKPSEASIVMTVVDDKGEVLDEITTTTQVPASIYNPSTGGRMHTSGKQLGRIVAKYMSGRLTCAAK